MLPNVTYDASQRTYEVVGIDEEIHTFPAGREGRRRAFQMALFVTHQPLFQLTAALIGRYPVLETRLWRAAELVLRDGVTLDPFHQVAAVVDSSNEYGGYQIQRHDGSLRCDCLDYRDFGAPMADGTGQFFCKHILAAELKRHLDGGRVHPTLQLVWNTVQQPV